MGKMADPTSMKSAFAILDQMKKRGVIEKYAVGGAVAASIHLRPATTADIDIFFVVKVPTSKLLPLKPIYDYLLSKGGKIDGQYIVYAGWPLQFLPGDTTPLVAEAVDRARLLKAGTVSVPVFTPEHLAAIALETGRPKDKVRLHELMESGILHVKEFKDIIHRHGLTRKYEQWQRSQEAF